MKFASLARSAFFFSVPSVSSARRALLFVSTAFALSAPACWQTTLMGRCEKGASLADPCGDVSPSFHALRR